MWVSVIEALKRGKFTVDRHATLACYKALLKTNPGVSTLIFLPPIRNGGIG